MNPLIIGLGVLAIFIWSKLSPKTEVKVADVAADDPGKTIIDKLKEGAAKVVAIVGGGGAAVAAGGGAAAAVGGGAAAVGGAAIVAPVVAVSALPAATVLPAGLSALAPTTLTSAVYGGTPAVVGTGAGTSSVGAGVGGTAGLGTTLLGAAVFVAPAVIMVGIAKVLDLLSPKKPPSPERLAAEAEAREYTNLMVSTGSMSYDPKTGFVDDPDDPSAYPGGK